MQAKFNTNKMAVLLIAILTVAIVLYLFGDGINGNDFWWHVKAGEYICKTGKVPQTDIFSWIGMEKGISWTAHEWLSEVVLYLVFSTLGEVGPYLLALISAVTMLCLLYHEVKNKIERNILISGLYFVLLSVVLSMFFCGRPQIFSYFFIFAELKILYSYYSDNTKKSIYLIPVMAVFWSNLHGGSSSLAYLLCLPFIVIGIKDINIGKISSNRLETKALVRLCAVMLLAGAAILVNPIGLKVLYYPYQNLSDSLSMNAISEWSSPDAKKAGMLIVGFLPILLMSIGFVSTQAKVKTIDLAIMAVFVFLFLRSIRFLMLWYIAAAFCAFDYIPELRIKKITKKGEVIVVYVALAAALVGAAFGAYKTVNKAVKGDIISKVLSDKAVEVIKADAPKRIFNDYNFGETLIYNDLNTFFDARADLFAQENIMRDALCLANIMPFDNDAWEEGETVEKLIEKYDFDAFVILKIRPLYSYLLSHPERFRLEYEETDMAYFITTENTQQ